MTFTEKLDRLMRENGYKNIKQFAEAVGMPYTTVKNWFERGYKGMQVQTLRQICDFFDVTMDSMVYDDREIMPRKRSWQGRALGLEDEAVLNCFWNTDGLNNRIIFGLAHDQYSDAQREIMAEVISPDAFKTNLTQAREKKSSLSEIA